MFALREELRRLARRRPEARITLVRSGALGDTILLLPTMRRLEAAFPRGRLTLVGSEWARRLLPMLEGPWEVLEFGAPELARMFTLPPPVDPPAALKEADFVALYTADPEGPLVRNVREVCRGQVVTWPVHPPAGIHAAQHFAEAVAEARPGAAELLLPALKAETFRKGIGGHSSRAPGGNPDAPQVCVHCGSGGTGKCWPARGFARVVRQLLGRGVRVVMLKGPADGEACDAVRAELSERAWPPMVEGEDLGTVAGLIGAVDAFLGNDSGISHLAAAVGTPTVVVFGPTDPAVWRPLGQVVRIVRGQKSHENPGGWPDPERVLKETVGLLQSNLG